MSENGAPLVAVAPRPQLLIALLPDGNVTVTGPLANRGLCYLMLGLARDAIHAWRPDDQPRVTLAPRLP